jgi:NAD+ synthase (glutamine-hydrolysing)
VFRARLRDPRRRDSMGSWGEEHDFLPVRRIELPYEAARRAGARRRPRITPGIAPQLDPSAELHQALVLGLGDYVRKNRFEAVVLGLSGGIDSALAATLAVDALGPERVIGVSMPSRFTAPRSQDDAQELARRLGIRFLTIPIADLAGAYERALGPVFAGQPADVTEENLQARIRGNTLMALSNKFGWLVLATGNKSEVSVGYNTLYGDTAGGFAVLKDVPKTVVYVLSRARNERALKAGQVAPIPDSTLTRPPTAELRPDQRDEDSLPPYSVLDPILEAYVEQDESPEDLVAEGLLPELVDRVVRMVDGNEYKRRQTPPGIKVTPRAFGRDRRLPISHAFRREADVARGGPAEAGKPENRSRKAAAGGRPARPERA